MSAPTKASMEAAIDWLGDELSDHLGSNINSLAALLDQREREVVERLAVPTDSCVVGIEDLRAVIGYSRPGAGASAEWEAAHYRLSKDARRMP